MSFSTIKKHFFKLVRVGILPTPDAQGMGILPQVPKV